MGEIADSMIDGTVCQFCGVFLGGSTGYPRSCPECAINAPSIGGPFPKRGKPCDKKLPCNQCDRTFRDESALDQHSVQKHGAEPKTKRVRKMLAEGKIKKGTPDGQAN